MKRVAWQSGSARGLRVRPLPLSVVAFIICTLPGLAQSGQVLDIAEWPPYITESAEGGGLLSQITVRALAESNIESRLVFKSWPRVTFDIDNNQAVSFGWIPNTERQQKWLYSDIILEGVTGFFYHQENPVTWQSLDDLSNRVIAVSAGYSYGDRFDSARGRLTLHENNNDLTNLRMLIRQRVDLAIMDPLVGRFLIDKHIDDEQAETLIFDWDNPVHRYTLHLVCSRQSESCESLITDFNSGLQRLRESGEYKAMLRSAYGPVMP